MVLQRGGAVLRGTAAPGSTIRARIAGVAASSATDASGAWRIALGASLAAGGPFDLTLDGDGTVVVHDVLIGDVWLGSGQSNMELPVASATDLAAPRSAADCTRIRLFTVPWGASTTPADDSGGAWRVCSPDAVRGFSAIGYSFAQALATAIDAPVGMIVSARGSTSIDAWTPADQVPGEHAALDVQHARGPAVTYNAMIRPLTPLRIRGVLWYQGEGDAGSASGYRDRLARLIARWRDAWSDARLPLLIVQLPGYADVPQTGAPAGSWAEIRDAQLRTLGIPGTALVTTVDLGDPHDIHPRRKAEVGRRLARAALRLVYGRDVAASGPRLAGTARTGPGLRLEFAEVGAGLRTSDGAAPSGFALSADGRTFLPASARIVGRTTVEVHRDDLPRPQAVRYAWADDPACNLTDGEGLPASPFGAALGQDAPVPSRPTP